MKLDIEGVKGCTDGGCIFGHPGGMHTNGGCHCLRDVRPTSERLRLMRNVHLLVKEVQRLRAGLLGHACHCGSNDLDPNVHREDCPYRKWALPEKP